MDGERGPMNTGGLHGERAGWHLPGSGGWQRTPGRLTPGVSWYRTEFELDLPRGHDVSLGLRFEDTTARGYRVLVFVNGWNMGQYLNDVGPQRDFVLPAGVLRDHNTLTFAVIATEAAQGDPGKVSLVTLGNHRTGAAAGR
jgi:hypothetical protein